MYWMLLTSLCLPFPLHPWYPLEMRMEMQTCPTREHIHGLIFLQEEKWWKGLLEFKLIFWILCCPMERNLHEWLFLPVLKLMMCFCLIDFNCELVLTGLVRTESYALGSCKTVTVDLSSSVLFYFIFYPPLMWTKLTCCCVPSPSSKLRDTSCFHGLRNLK